MAVFITDGPFPTGRIFDSLQETSLKPLYPSIEKGCLISDTLAPAICNSSPNVERMAGIADLKCGPGLSLTTIKIIRSMRILFRFVFSVSPHVGSINTEHPKYFISEPVKEKNSSPS